jgi:hypothetical protein
MNEKDLLGLKLNESLRTEDGGRYTRTLGGWIYTNFAGNILFIPEPSVVKENLITKKADKKANVK